MIRTLLIVLVVGCSAGDSGQPGDDTPAPDAPAGCSVTLASDPMPVFAAPQTELRVTANVEGAQGVLGYTWQVTHGGAPVTFNVASSNAITFYVPNPGPYRVMVAVSGTAFCPTAQADINVGVPNGTMTQVRLRVFPPPTIAAPPQEHLELIPSGANYALNDVTVYPGVMASGSTGVQAYLRFMPVGARGTFVETFTATDGKFANVLVLNQNHDVLVVPLVAGYAPRLVEEWMPNTPFPALTAGTMLTGVVRAPDGSAVANAQVQLALDGVPSTLATTSTTGTFTVLAFMPASANVVHVEVTPPPASGLPRIAGGSDTLTATSTITVQYSPALIVRNAGGAVVRRGGAAQPNAPVKLVGTISAVATITAGQSTSANGEVRIATTTTGTGALPAGLLAPAVPLFGVSTIGGQLAVGAFDLTSSVPSTIDAPAPVQIDTQLRSPTQAALPDALIELVPSGALALAGAPAIRAIANSSGNVSLLVPANGRFDVRASDPLGRAAPLVVSDVPTAGLAAAYALQKALHVTGSLVLSGNSQVVGRGSVQILCTQCTGIDRERPIAEGATTGTGAFDVAIFDPGTLP